MSKQVRVRFAPSPTGPYILAAFVPHYSIICLPKKTMVFFLRIEDTDQNRFVPGAEEYIMEALRMVRIAPDETIGKNENLVHTVKAKEKICTNNMLLN
jgi:glutamyl-tRNA synthetase